MNGKKIILGFVLIFIGFTHIAYSLEEIKFSLPDFPPYVFEKDNKIQGIGIDLVDKVLKNAGIQYSVELVPNYGKAVSDVKNGKADGFFLASQNAERDDIAVLSKPIVINRWCWFYKPDSHLNPKDDTFKSKAKVGTVLNSNTHKWLTEKGYNVAGAPPEIDLLLKMFKADRINVFFLAEAVFMDSIHKTGEKSGDYIKVIQEEKPFGIYISKKYISKNPEVVNKINDSISKVIGKAK